MYLCFDLKLIHTSTPARKLLDVHSDSSLWCGVHHCHMILDLYICSLKLWLYTDCLKLF